jgi:hypothetical protein
MVFNHWKLQYLELNTGFYETLSTPKPGKTLCLKGNSMPVSCESTSLQVDCSLVLEIVAARQWPNPGQISIALLIGDEVCANNCLSHKLTTKLQVCEKAPTQKIYIYISKHIGIRFATKGAEAMDMTKRSTKTMTKSLLESCSTSTLSHAQLTGNISWILTLGSFDSVRFL